MNTIKAESAAVTKVSRTTIEGIEAILESWLDAHVPDCAGARVKSLRSSSSGGLSGETHILLLDSAEATAGNAPHAVVLKKDVREKQTNPQSNFANLVAVQTVLGDLPELPVPRILGVEHSSELLGAPFLVMEYVEGQIPSDVPSYAASGWVFDASAEQRRALWQSGIDFLVRLHDLDWRKYSLEQLRFEAPGEDDLERCLNHSIALFRTEADGLTTPICEQAIAWLLAHRPAAAGACICWGDARIGNIIWRDFECVAAIDWEMSSLGCPGIDLGWWSFFHRWSTLGQGYADLDGMCVGPALAELYAARGGKRIEHFSYYEVLAAVRGLSIWLRTYKTLKAAGAFPDISPLDDSIHMVRVLNTLMLEAG